MVTGLEGLPLLNLITDDAGFDTAIYFTYGIDLAFFEQAILHPLWHKGCRNHLVFIDAQRYADTLTDLRGSVTKVGQRYILIPVDLGPFRSFHPKMVLLLGNRQGRLLVGSGNLTFTGFGKNYEVFTQLDWTPDQAESQYSFFQMWGIVTTVLDRWGHNKRARIMLGKTRAAVTWLATPCEPTTEIQIFHTLEKSLLDQCCLALGTERIDRITIFTPFLDKKALALKELNNQFQPQKLRLVLQSGQAVGNRDALQDLQQAGVPIDIHTFTDNERYLHAKIYLL